MMKYTLELKIDVPPETLDAFQERLKLFARTMLTMATLATQGRRKPRVILKGDDFFTAEHDIEILDDMLNAETEEVISDDTGVPR